MTLTIDLTPEQEAALEAEAAERGMALPEFARLRLLEGVPVRRMTPREALAYWAEDDSPSVFGRDTRDATVIARELRTKAEQRDWSQR